MKKVFFLLQVLLLTIVVQTGFAQEAEVTEPNNVTTEEGAPLSESKIIEKLNNKQMEKQSYSGYETIAKEKVPIEVMKAFEQKNEGAVIENISVSAQGVYQIIAESQGKKFYDYFGNDGEEFH